MIRAADRRDAASPRATPPWRRCAGPARAHARALLPLALAATFAAGCARHHGAAPAGPGGPGGNPGGPGGGPGGTAAPPAPVSLRLAATPAGPPSYRLEWDQPPAVAVELFEVYAATTPISAPEPSLLVATAAGGERSAAVVLSVDTGLRHLRVRAVAAGALAGPLSPQLAVDTAGRVVFASAAGAGGAEDLFAAVPGGAAPAANLTLLPQGRAVEATGLSPDGRWLWFLAERGPPGVRELFRTGLGGGGGPAPLSGTMVAGGNVLPGVQASPDGTRIAFAADRETDELFELWVVPADGGAAPLRVSGTMAPGGGLAAGGAASLAWSPDGTRVAYAADQQEAGVRELMVAAADGGAGPVAVSGALVATATVLEFAWSPNGTTLAFTADRDEDSVFELWTAPADGSAAPVVRSGARNAAADAFFPRWSPDGTRIAFVSSRRVADVLEVYVADAVAGGEPWPVDQGMPAHAGATRFAWSPDGTQLAFVADRTADTVFELCVAPAGGAPAAAIVSGAMQPDGDVGAFAWSPDGTQLAFVADRSTDELHELFVTVPGLAGAPLRASGALAATADVLDFAWSTEGGRLAFRADARTDGRYELHVVDRLASAPPRLQADSHSGAGAPPAAWTRLGRQ